MQLDDEYSARCLRSHGADTLIVTPLHRAAELVMGAFPQSWGLHVDDPNLAMGNLVGLVQSESAAYATMGGS